MVQKQRWWKCDHSNDGRCSHNQPTAATLRTRTQAGQAWDGSRNRPLYSGDSGRGGPSGGGEVGRDARRVPATPAQASDSQAGPACFSDCLKGPATPPSPLQGDGQCPRGRRVQNGRRWGHDTLLLLTVGLQPPLVQRRESSLRLPPCSRSRRRAPGCRAGRAGSGGSCL